jgi:2-dehydropantoate 2-reductase
LQKTNTALPSWVWAALAVILVEGLRRAMQGSDECEIIFIARGENEKVIREKGLKLITSKGEQVVHPAIVSHDPVEIGPIDLLLCCTKAYALEDGLRELKKNISAHTFILPLLNGVENSERIRGIVPGAHVLQGFAYIVTRLLEPGVVKESGNIDRLLFGSGEEPEQTLKDIERRLRAGGIDATYTPEILTAMWVKYIFISAIATLTSALDKSIGQIREVPEHREILRRLIDEVIAIAHAKKILLPDDILQQTWATVERLPYENTSSMHADFRRGHKSEVDVLTSYVSEQGEELEVDHTCL